jgi:hypothetical protein
MDQLYPQLQINRQTSNQASNQRNRNPVMNTRIRPGDCHRGYQEYNLRHTNPTTNPHLKRSFSIFAFEPEIEQTNIPCPPSKRTRESIYQKVHNPVHILEIWSKRAYIREPLKASADEFYVSGTSRYYRGEVLCQGKQFHTKKYHVTKREAKTVVCDGVAWWLCYGSQFQEWETFEVSQNF